MSTELVKLDVEQYGLTEEKAKNIEALYLPMIEQLNDFENQFNEIVTQEITPVLVTKAKRLRLDISKVRLNADKKRSEAKADFLRANKAIQGAYNTLEYVVKSKESKLQDIENFYAQQERDRIAKVQQNRTSDLEKYGIEIIPGDLGLMNDEFWNIYLTGVKANYEAKIQAEKEIEEKRIAKEKADKLHLTRKNSLLSVWDFIDDSFKSKYYGDIDEKEWKSIVSELQVKKEKWFNGLERKNSLGPFWDFLKDDQKSTDWGEIPQESFEIIFKEAKTAKEVYDLRIEEQRKENERLIKEAEEKERLVKIERERIEKEREIERKRQAEILERQRKEADENARIEKDKKAKIEAALIAEVEAERKERLLIENELKAKQLKEQRLNDEQSAKIQAELSKGDIEKMKDLITDLEVIKTKYAFKSDKYKNTYHAVHISINDIISFISE